MTSLSVNTSTVTGSLGVSKAASDRRLQTPLRIALVDGFNRQGSVVEIRDHPALVPCVYFTKTVRLATFVSF